jgi:hypothetical protein
MNLTFGNLVVTLCMIRYNVKKFYILPKECVYVFFMYLRTNGDYFRVLHSNSD